VLRGGLEDLPGSFNVGEAFQKFLPPSATFEIRPERDHLFSFDDFVDHLTSTSDFVQDDIGDFTEHAVIYSYNSTSDPTNLEFSTKTGKTYGFSSVSLIRFGREVSMILLAGRICDLEKESVRIREFEPTESFAHRAHIQPNADEVLRAAPLFEGSDLWKTVVLARFELDSRTVDVRYVYEDWGRLYHGETDDRNSFLDNTGNFINEKAKVAYEKSGNRISEYDALFELCKTCLMLPKYFDVHDDEIVIERHATEFLEFRKKLSNSKYVSRVGSAHQISHRNVKVLPKKTQRTPNKSEFYAPNYKVETKGFWKRLSPNAVGRDKNGNAIHGRTWVSQTESWVEEVDGAPIVATKLKVPVNSENAGSIYVMRSAAHQKDIFKVGLTRRDCEQRARELTRTTGSPDQFLVVQEWAVSDCVLAERLIHEELQLYRINPNREFFKAPYTVIRSAIDSVVDALEPPPA
jgi:hypothetical protein